MIQNSAETIIAVLFWVRTGIDLGQGQVAEGRALRIISSIFIIPLLLQCIDYFSKHEKQGIAVVFFLSLNITGITAWEDVYKSSTD